MGHLGQTWLAQLHQHLPKPILIYNNTQHQATIDLSWYINNLPSIMPTGKQCKIPFHVLILPTKQEIIQSSSRISNAVKSGHPFNFDLYRWHIRQKFGKKDKNRLDGNLRALEHDDHNIQQH